MERNKQRVVRLVVLAAVGVVVAASAMGPAQASTAPSPSPVAGMGSPVPDPNAAAGGEVAGVRRGAQVSGNEIAEVQRFRAAHDSVLPRTSSSARQAPRTIHPAQGTALLNADGVDGASATHSVAPRLTITTASSTVYAPTIYPPSGACIEVSTRYTKGTRDVAAWDWCGSINFAAVVPIDENFLAKYTTGGGGYSVRIVQTDRASNAWTASLFNYKANTWDTLLRSSGSSQGGHGGWDIYELYSEVDATTGESNACGDVKGATFDASHITVRSGGQWAAAGAGNADTHYDQPAANFDCPSRQYDMVNDYDHWTARG